MSAASLRQFHDYANFNSLTHVASSIWLPEVLATTSHSLKMGMEIETTPCNLGLLPINLDFPSSLA